MSTNNNNKDMLEFAKLIAEEAGQIALRYFRTNLNITSKSDSRFDPVTIADQSIEKLLREKISEKFPDHGIIGEEQGVTKGNKFTWVIDPIDGTSAFISGSPMWGILIGLTENDKPLLGVMHQPWMKETFYADSNSSWWAQESSTQQIKTRQTKSLADANLFCTHPSMFTTEKDQKLFKSVADSCQYSRYGSDCYGYCLLSAGFVDLVIEGSLQPYDIVPLIPIIESAGGIVTDWQGKPAVEGGKIVAAANKTLHESALSLLAS